MYPSNSTIGIEIMGGIFEYSKVAMQMAQMTVPIELDIGGLNRYVVLPVASESGR